MQTSDPTRDSLDRRDQRAAGTCDRQVAARRGIGPSALLAILSVILAVPGAAHDGDYGTAALRELALRDDTALRVASSLSTEVGARPTGTPAMERARDWAVATLKALGFSNIRVETFATPTWTRRGTDRAELVGPYPRNLQVLALGGSTPTPSGGLTAPIALFRTYQQMLDQAPGSLRGKIAVVTQPMARTQDLSGYLASIPQRIDGPTEAATRGASGYLMRSLSSGQTRLPHTGTASSGGIPAAALSPPDAELLERLVATGRPVSVRLDLDSVTSSSSVAYNISAEIPGQRPEMIVVGGHLDSWDPGTGAVDDGAGIGIALAAASLARIPNELPQRTIRVVLWGAEEQRGSSAAYAAAHRDEIGRMVIASESDLGADRAFAVALPGGSLEHPVMRLFRDAMVPLGVLVRSTPARTGGADVEDLAAAGAPVLEVSQDLTRYMQFHHSADDTFDKIDPPQLAQNVAVLAIFLRLVAYSDVDFRALAAAAH